MSLCTDLARCSPLNYCQAEGAVLNIGQLVDTPYPGTARVKFTDLSTERETVIDNADTLPNIGIDTEDFTPIAGHVYQIEVVLSAETGGIIPIPFTPYTMDGNDLEGGTTSYMYATVRFVKVFTLTDTVDTVTEQWLTLRP